MGNSQFETVGDESYSFIFQISGINIKNSLLIVQITHILTSIRVDFWLTHQGESCVGFMHVKY